MGTVRRRRGARHRERGEPGARGTRRRHRRSDRAVDFRIVTNRSLAAAGAAAIALFAAGVLVLLWSAAGTPAPHPRGPGQREDAAGMPPSIPLPIAPDGAASTRIPSAPAPPVAPPPAPEDLDPSWRESPVASRVRQLGAVAPYVYSALRDARTEMRFCFDAQGAREGGPAAAEQDVGDSPAVLVLYLEAREGAIDVVEVGIDRLGTLPREVVECCREVLRGHEIRAPNAVPGRRYRLSHLLP
jgi:hypothetical protein